MRVESHHISTHLSHEKVLKCGWTTGGVCKYVFKKWSFRHNPRVDSLRLKVYIANLLTRLDLEDNMVPRMSQSHIRRQAVESPDWMRELESDSMQVQAMLSRMDELCKKALFNLGAGNTVDAGIRLVEVREGLRLIGSLMGIKLQA